APLSAIANGATELRMRPQGLTRFLSLKRAMPRRSETRLVWKNNVDGKDRSSRTSRAGRREGSGRLRGGAWNSCRKCRNHEFMMGPFQKVFRTSFPQTALRTARRNDRDR